MEEGKSRGDAREKRRRRGKGGATALSQAEGGEFTRSCCERGRGQRLH